MANRRMFSKTITSSSQFLMMPQSSQNLYFHLGMNADDDGFCEHFSIMRMTDSKPDDLKVLQAKSFVEIFDDKVLVIKDWKENNYIQADRYSPSKYLQIYKKELKIMAQQQQKDGIQNVYKLDTQVRLGKVRLGKVRLGEDRIEKKEGVLKESFNHLGAEIIKAMTEIDPKNKNYYNNTTQRSACDFLLKEYGLEEVLARIAIIPKLNKIPYFPTIHTPYDLQEKWVKLEEAVAREKIKLKNNEREVII